MDFSSQIMSRSPRDTLKLGSRDFSGIIRWRIDGKKPRDVENIE